MEQSSPHVLYPHMFIVVMSYYYGQSNRPPFTVQGFFVIKILSYYFMIVSQSVLF